MEPRKILWAVNPQPEEHEYQRQTALVLRSFARRGNSTVQPVAVLSPEQAGASEITPPPRWNGDYQLAVREGLRELISLLDLPNVVPPEVLIQPRPSLKKSVLALLDFARAMRTDVIVTGTHARSGVSRLLLGSFAETLLSYSPIPVLTVNPHAGTPRDFERIVFPTELDPHGGVDSLDRAIRLACFFKAELLLLHKFEPWLLPLREPATEVQLMMREKETLRERGGAWTARATAQGITARFFFDETSGTVVESILRHAADEDATLIALNPHTDSAALAPLSLATRQVVRDAACPVLTLKPAAPR